MMEFSYFHAYRRLSRRDLVAPLVCERCSNEYVVMTDGEIEPQPVLFCAFCDTTLTPSKKMYDEIVEKVDSFR